MKNVVVNLTRLPLGVSNVRIILLLTEMCHPCRHRILLLNQIDTNNRKVTGVAVLLSVNFVRKNSDSMYNHRRKHLRDGLASPSSFADTIVIDGMKDGYDMIACYNKLCICITDRAECCVWQVSLDKRRSQKKCLAFHYAPKTLSLSPSGKLLVLTVDRSVSGFGPELEHINTVAPLNNSDHRINHIEKHHIL